MRVTRTVASLCLLLVSLLPVIPLFAASPPPQVWSSMVISRTSAHGIRIELEHQLRSRFDTPVFKETFYELRLSYAPQPRLDVTLFYRQVFYADNTAWRLAAAPQIKDPFGLDGLKLRLKVQRHAPSGQAATWHTRFRATFAYPLGDGPCTLYAQAEPWWALTDPVTLSRYRLDAGFQLKRSDGCRYEVYYRFQGDYSDAAWQGTNILGLKLQAAL